MRIFFLFLLLYFSNSFSDNHVYLELNCSTEIGDRTVLILKQLPTDDSGSWIEEVPFTSAGYFNNELYLTDVKEKKLEMKLYSNSTDKSYDTQDKLQEMVVIDRYDGTLARIYFNEDGSINRDYSFSGVCKKRTFLKKQF